jgi:hypothetical protein
MYDMLGLVVVDPLKRKIIKIPYKWYDIDGLWCLTPLLPISQLHRGGQFYWWSKPEYPENKWYSALLSSWYMRTLLWGKDIDMCQCFGVYKLLSNYNIKYICTTYTRLCTCIASIPRFALREKVTLRLLKLLLTGSGCGRVV